MVKESQGERKTSFITLPVSAGRVPTESRDLLIEKEKYIFRIDFCFQTTDFTSSNYLLVVYDYTPIVI